MKPPTDKPDPKPVEGPKIRIALSLSRTAMSKLALLKKKQDRSYSYIVDKLILSSK